MSVGGGLAFLQNRHQKRILCFVSDGTGLGHLSRICRIAGALQGPCACLIVTGHRFVGAMVPAACEFVHIPSFDSLLPGRARNCGQDPFLKIRLSGAMQLRAHLIEATLEAFQPDAILVDHRPAGHYNELLALLKRSPARKYLVFRGILGISETERMEIFEGECGALLEAHFERILVACDRRIVDISAEYGLSPSLARKVIYMGYAMNTVSPAQMRAAREERGLQPGDRWVVCSAGGGKFGGQLIKQCMKLAAHYQDVHFDIVVGPKANTHLAFPSENEAVHSRIRLYKETPYLPLMQASCDLAVGSGGYNAFVEAMAGATPIITVPTEPLKGDEQYIQAQRLAPFYPVTLVNDLEALEHAFDAVLERLEADRLRAQTTDLDKGGLQNLRRYLFEELGITARDSSVE
jgi:predicted glycosyltransferase